MISNDVFTGLELMHLLCQTVAIILWLYLIKISVSSLRKLSVQFVAPIIIVAFFIAINLMIELHLNDFRKGSSMWLWYPANYILVFSYVYLIRLKLATKHKIAKYKEKIEKLKALNNGN